MIFFDKYFGIIDNPIVKTPYNNGSGGGIVPSNSFLLLDGEPFSLLDNTFFLLLE
jgi:hypothetical protein